jgi:hypothetical protein
MPPSLSVVPGTLILVPRTAVRLAQDPDLRHQRAQLLKRLRRSCSSSSFQKPLEEEEKHSNHLIASSSTWSNCLGPQEPTHGELKLGKHQVPGQESSEFSNTGQDVGGVEDARKEEEDEFWAQLDSRVYASLAEAQHLLQRQSQQLMVEMEAKPVFWQAKDDVTFSSIAADIVTSFTL